jgi:hypothetical protein
MLYIIIGILLGAMACLFLRLWFYNKSAYELPYTIPSGMFFIDIHKNYIVSAPPEEPPSYSECVLGIEQVKADKFSLGTKNGN